MARSRRVVQNRELDISDGSRVSEIGISGRRYPKSIREMCWTQIEPMRITMELPKTKFRVTQRRPIASFFVIFFNSHTTNPFKL